MFHGKHPATAAKYCTYNTIQYGNRQKLHLLAGYAVALTFGIFSPAAGAVAGILAAFGKEFVWDKWMKRGTFEWQDLNLTLVGVLVGFILAFVRSAV